ncbi:RxLR effector protein [Phytophthora megakarya]|uniref:RxLR effector protein n=1 Tax=Phytophthora megakarya TaxID=4795 RepID=A0A225UXF5_9STRA|nr:RxLR effector protein [Phytophthora megakarya]
MTSGKRRSNGFKERSLETVVTDSPTDYAYTVDEDRGVQVAILSKLSNWETKMKLKKTAKNLKFRVLLNPKKTPAQVYTDLKFTKKRQRW